MKASEKILKEREEKLKIEIDKKLTYTDNLKSYVAHIQNEEVIAHLTEYKKSLSTLGKTSLLPQVFTKPQSNTMLAEKIKKMLVGLQKLLVLVNYAEGSKFRTDKFTQNQINPLKGTISEFAIILAKHVKELMTGVHRVKSVQYLQRKLYIRSSPELFPTDKDKDLFLNTAFFNTRFKDISKAFATIP